MAGRPKKEPIEKQEKPSQTQTKDPKLEAVRMAMEQIQKQYGKGAIMRLGERKPPSDEDVIPTGSHTVNFALGVGGLPRGRIVEIFGPEASGKTTLTLSVIAQAQKKGGIAAFIDAEHALDPTWAEIIGVKLEDLLISQPDTGEQALEIAETLIRSGGIDVLVIDSVAALVPRSEIEGEMGEAQMGVQARLMSQALRKLTGVISRSKTVCIFTNQIRQKIGIMFGNPETTPGGLAMKFYSSIRIDIRKIKAIKKGEDFVGSRHRVKVVKNKVAPPFKIAEFEILSDGISRVGELIDLGLETNVLERNGSFIKYADVVIGQGREAAMDYLKENPESAKNIFKEIWKKKREVST
jgi:recombination protein RecA